ncbi:MAG: HDIG domain-containing protein [Balneolaceae bacterium]|nr:MAG: HDIG domain-containing protein [Balneolaceae bacterium]
MSILKKLGLAQKKSEVPPPIGVNKVKEQKEATERRNKYFRIVTLLVFLAVVLVSLPQTTFQPVASYSINEPWRADDLTAPFTFAIKKTDSELQQEREEIRQQTAPIFHVDNNALVVIESRVDSIYRALQPVMDSYVHWRRSLSANDESAAESDSLQFIQDRDNANVRLNSDAWNALLENYASVVINNQPERRAVVFQIRSQIFDLIDLLIADGIIDRSKDEIDNNEIIIRNLRQLTERSVSLANVRDPREASDFAQLQLSRAYLPEVSRAAHQLFNQVIQPNLFYSEADTDAYLEEQLANISTTRGAVDQGQIIVRRGDIVTPEIDNILRSLAEARALTATELERWLRYFGEAIVVIIATLMFFIYIFLYRKKIYELPSMFLLVFLVMGIVALASALIYPFDNVNSYIVPIAVAPIILTIIFDSRVGLMATVTLAIITGVVHDYNFEYLVATIAACSLGVFSVRDIKKRSQFFFITPGIVFISYMLVISGFGLARFTGWEKFFSDLFFVGVNSVFILFTYPLILLFEKLFKITTDFTLLELADTNLPLMKELMSKAPGTFHHSLQVANLAESAASDIGANALLCRVGAMYHDVGKMVKPSYFIENQNKSNDHDKLKPRMSALVIKAHVSEGVKIAKENNLPDLIIDLIKTHHGTSLIRYFHQKASEDSETIQEEDFRYDGPTPFTKEQGILMLADGVEASCRSMKDTTYSKLENQIDRIIDSSLNDDQLKDCPLTFRQIQIIKESFLRILKGVYHSRIEYPDEKKPAKKEQLQENKNEDIATDSEEKKVNE